MLSLAYFFFGHSIPIGSYLLILVLDGLAIMFGYIYFYKGLEKGLVSIVGPISSMWAAVTVIMGVLLLNEQLSLLKIIAIIFIVIGGGLVSLDFKELKSVMGKRIQDGVKEGLIAMLSWGGLVVLVTPIIRTIGWFMPLLVARFFVVIPLYMIIKAKKIKVKFGYSISLLGVILAVALMDVFGFVGLNKGLASGAASLVAPVAAAYPLITIILAHVFLKERLQLSQYLGIATVLVGLVMISI